MKIGPPVGQVWLTV